MFTLNQIKRAMRLVVRQEKTENNFKVRTGHSEYNVDLTPKPTCDCYHFANKTVHDIVANKPFLETWWCSHLLAVFIEIDWQGFRRYAKQLIAEGGD